MSLSCSSPSPSCQTPANLSFICNGTKASQSCTKSGRFAVGSERRHSAKAPVYSARLASQAVNVFLELVEDETSTRADKVHGLAALHAKWSYEDVEEPVEEVSCLVANVKGVMLLGQLFLDSPCTRSKLTQFGTYFMSKQIYYFWGKPGLAKALSFSCCLS